MSRTVLAPVVFVLLAAALASPALAVPGEVANLRWCAGPTNCLQWDVEPSATQYRLYRGESASLPCLLNPSVESCDDGTFATNTTSGTVSEIPSSGGFFWFLVTAQNGSGEGGPGSASSGPRLKNDTGACLPSCGLVGSSCSFDGDCCSASCIGTCQAACCQPAGAFCGQHSDCCSGACSGGLCQSSCTSPSQCPGVDSDCQTRTCTAGACGISYTAAGTPTSSQLPGDCAQRVCDGAGNSVSVGDNSDVPIDDNNQCTGEVCTAGVPNHPPLPLNSACNQNGGVFCSATGACVECNSASQCAGTDTECRSRSCSANTCGITFVAAGTPTSSQAPGDCQRNECDGSGNSVSVNDSSDVPIDDGNQCTGEVCTGGAPTHPPAAIGTACNQGGGTVCNGAGACVVPPQVATTGPADGASAPAPTTVTVTFTQAMNPATLSDQTAGGECTGSIQVSLDDFATCVGFSTATPAMSGGNTVATLVPQPGLLVNRTYKVRVTTAAQNAPGVPLGATFTHTTGFATTSPNLCDGSLVISQVYGGGGLAGAAFRNDFIELHNRGSAPISLTGKSVQYASAAGTTWLNQTNLSGTIPAGGYYLIQEASSAANGAVLPAPDMTGTIDMGSTAGKVALVANQTSLVGGCPLGAAVIDFVGYGPTANCNEGGANAQQPSVTTSISRGQGGCLDLNTNGTDFTAGAPGPRNSGAPANVCACVAQNESNTAAEADYCAVVFPASLNLETGISTGSIYGQIFEGGVTAPPGPAASVLVQLGYGPFTANPEYQPGWTWFNSSYNVQVGNNDEYQASFTAPVVGTYHYTYRFSLDGVGWTYCDSNLVDGGAGSNAGLTFDVENQPILTVTP